MSMVAMLTMTAGRAEGQVVVGGPGVEAGDPTQETGPYCPLHIIPTPRGTLVGDGDCLWGPSPLGVLLPGYSNSWVMSTYYWHKDRRPLVVIQMGSNGFRFNPRGSVDWWWMDIDNDPATCDQDVAVDTMQMNPEDNSTVDLIPTENDQGNGIPDQFETLIHRIRYYKYHGFRRVVMHLPAGVQGVRKSGQVGPDANGNIFDTHGGTNQSMNQFRGMPQWKKDYFVDPTGAWQQFVQAEVSDNPDAEPNKLAIEVYVGGGLGTEPCKLYTQDTVEIPGNPGPYHRILTATGLNPLGVVVTDYVWSETNNQDNIPFALDPSNESMNRMFWNQIAPWIDSRVKSIWLDSASENNPIQPFRWGSMEMAHNPHLRSLGVRIGGETIPTIDNGGQVPDDCAIANMKWFVNTQVAMDSCGTGCRTFKPLFNFNPRSNSEIHLLDNENGMTWIEWKEARERGFVVSMYGGKGIEAIELTKRWYSMGPIRVADFDGDGTVDIKDYTLAHNTIAYGIDHPADVPIKIFATGDIDGNGVIDNFDNIVFDFYWSIEPDTIVNYGEAKGL
jgi:hypothetical protein